MEYAIKPNSHFINHYLNWRPLLMRLIDAMYIQQSKKEKAESRTLLQFIIHWLLICRNTSLKYVNWGWSKACDDRIWEQKFIRHFVSMKNPIFCESLSENQLAPLQHSLNVIAKYWSPENWTKMSALQRETFEETLFHSIYIWSVSCVEFNKKGNGTNLIDTHLQWKWKRKFLIYETFSKSILGWKNNETSCWIFLVTISKQSKKIWYIHGVGHIINAEIDFVCTWTM